MELLKLEAKLTVLLEWITEYFGTIPDSLALKLNSIELKYGESDSIKQETEGANFGQNAAEFVSFGILDEVIPCFSSLKSKYDDLCDASTIPTYAEEDIGNPNITTTISNNSLVRTGQVKLIDIRTITASQESGEKEQTARMHECSHCSASFTSVDELSVHSLIHCEVRVLRSREEKSIKRSFVYNKNKLREMRKKKKVNMNASEVTCQLCPNSFPSERALQTHLKLVHPRSLPKNQCDICDINCKDKKYLERHMLKEHPETPHPNFTCPECSKTYQTKTYLNHHRKRVHTDSGLVFPCEICGKTFKHRQYAIDHVKKAHADPKNACHCDTCGKSYKTPQNLREHKKICKVEKSFLCQECGFAVNTESALRGHVERMHAKDRVSQKCPHCPNEFNTMEGLRNHVRRHFDKHLKPCPYCGVMKDITNLYNHIHIVHKGRKFKCPDCDAMFSHKAHLKNHYVLKHPDLEIPKEFAIVYTKHDALLNPDAPVPVPSAAVKTATKSSKTVKRHRSERVSDLVCSTCDSAFVTNDDLELHMIRHEKDPDYRMKRRVPVKRLQADQSNTDL